MPERLEKLLTTVQELQTELSALESMDPKARAALERVLGEINEALGKSGSGGGLDSHQSLIERLQETAVELETSHPTLIGVVERTINALGQMGI